MIETKSSPLAKLVTIHYFALMIRLWKLDGRQVTSPCQITQCFIYLHDKKSVDSKTLGKIVCNEKLSARMM